MKEKVFFIKILYKKSDKLRIWVNESELVNLLEELKRNDYDVISFNKSVELQVMEELNGILTTHYYDNIRNIVVDELINKSSINQSVKVEI